MLLIHVCLSVLFAAATPGGLSQEVIQKFAPPPLGQDESEKIARYMDIAFPTTGIYESASRNLFFNWRVSGQQQVWSMSMPYGYPIQVTGGSMRSDVKAVTPDGRTLVIERDRAGEENPGLYLFDRKAQQMRVLFHKNKVRALFQALVDGGVLFAHNGVNGRDSMLYKYEFASQKIVPLLEVPGTWDVTSVLGDRIVVANMKSSRASEIEVLSLKDGKRMPLWGQNEEETYLTQFGFAENEFFVATNSKTDLTSLYSVKNGVWAPVFLPEKGEVTGFLVHRPSQTLVVEYQEWGYRKVRIFQGPHLAPVNLPGSMIQAPHVRLGHMSRDGFFTFAVESSNAVSRNFVISVQDFNATEWTAGQAPELNVASFAPVSLEFYPARDGTPIPMLVRRPAECAKKLCPVVVSFHGGPEAQSDPVLNPVAQALVEEGIIYVEPNVRGSSGMGKKWLDSDNGPKRLNVVTDIEDAALFIRKNWQMQGQSPKIGVVGGSYGGYSTLMAMTRFAGAYDVGVSIVGISNLVTFLQNTAPYRRHLRESEYGKLAEDMEALVALSPMTYIDQIKAPLLIIQGVNDPRVPASEALQIYEVLEKKQIESGLILFADEGHGASKKENRILERGHTIRFLKKHLIR